MHSVIVVAVIFLVLYGLFHHRAYRRHRRSGLSVWVSMRGPWNTRISKRL